MNGETFWAVLIATIVGQFCVWIFKKWIEPRLEKAHDELETSWQYLKERLKP